MNQHTHSLHDILNSPNYSAREKQQLLDYAVLSLQGLPANPPAQRTTFQISSDATEEQIILAIAQSTQRSVEEIKALNLDFKSIFSQLNAHKGALSPVIEDFKAILQQNPKTAASKYEELNDVGRFIVASGNAYKIETRYANIEYPDFVINAHGDLIGLEHTRLLDKTDRELRSHLEKYLREAETRLHNLGINGPYIVNVVLNYHIVTFNDEPISSKKLTPDQKQIIIDGIVSAVKAEILNEKHEKPAFINRLVISDYPDSQLNLVLSEAYIPPQNFTELLKETIQRKENLYERYVNLSAVNRCWLLVIVNGIASYSGFDLAAFNEMPFPKSNFERIILFETFGGKIFDLR